jgi:hypothetical protein
LSDAGNSVLTDVKTAILVGVAIWLVLFPIGVLVTWGMARETSRWPIVTATASDHQLRRGKTGYHVVATLTYVHPAKPGGPLCVLKQFPMGQDTEPRSFSRMVELAVRPGSCYEPSRTPVGEMPSFQHWLLIFFGAIAGWSVFSVIGVLHDRLKTRLDARTARIVQARMQRRSMKATAGRSS